MINDSLGHLIGDQLIVEVAIRLEKCLRATDTVARLGEGFIVARLGATNLPFSSTTSKDPTDAKAAADRLMKAVTSPFHFGRQGSLHFRQHRDLL